MDSSIILIGPMSAGKSTIAQLLAEKLGIARYELDELRWDYYDEIGYDHEIASGIGKEKGMLGIIEYGKPYEAHAVERAVAEYKNCILDFGAGHSVFEDQALFTRVEQALSHVENVILLLPSPRLDESVAIVNERFSSLLEQEVGEIDPELLLLNEHFVRHLSNHKLAKWVVYTEGHTPEETCAQVLDEINISPDGT